MDTYVVTSIYGAVTFLDAEIFTVNEHGIDFRPAHSGSFQYLHSVERVCIKLVTEKGARYPEVWPREGEPEDWS